MYQRFLQVVKRSCCILLPGIFTILCWNISTAESDLKQASQHPDGLQILPSRNATNLIFSLTEQQALETALAYRGMTWQDLGFKKDHVKVEHRLHKVRLFMDAPWLVPGYAQRTVDQLRDKNLDFEACIELARNAMEIPPSRAIERNHGKPFKFENDAVLPVEIREALLTFFNSVGPVLETWSEAKVPEEVLLEFFDIEKHEDLIPYLEKLGFSLPVLTEYKKGIEELSIDEFVFHQKQYSPWLDSFKEHLYRESPVILRAVDQLAQELQHFLLAPENQGLSNSLTSHQFSTPWGTVQIGGKGHDRHDGGAFLTIDFGGDDFYHEEVAFGNGLQNRPLSLLIDLHGNDTYSCSGHFSQGSGLLGIGVLMDYEGNDVYRSGNASQGAAIYGIGILKDHLGNDFYEAIALAQGAAKFGTGIFHDSDGNDTYRASIYGQAASLIEGFSLCLDGAGNDQYYAGGRFSDHERFPRQYLSLSQGFAIGARPYAGGGIAILADLAGNDSYTADVYGQGVSYWYSLSMLLDYSGNDTYQLYQYGQGSGIHLSVGMLADWSGDDSYTGKRGLNQGAAHDWAVGWLVDKKGNDIYSSESSSQGGSINNSFAALIDRRGDDQYYGRDSDSIQGAGNLGRDYESIGVMLDLDGADHSSVTNWKNSVLWRRAGGILMSTNWINSAEEYPSATWLSQIPSREDTSFPAHLDVARMALDVEMDALLKLVARYADTIEKAKWKALAREKILKLGPAELKRMLPNLQSDDVMMKLAIQPLVDHLGTNAIPALRSGLDLPHPNIQRFCLYNLMQLEDRESLPVAREWISNKLLKPLAIEFTGKLGTHADAPLLLNELATGEEIILIRTAQALGRLKNENSIPALLDLMDHHEFSTVRSAASSALVNFGEKAVSSCRHQIERCSDFQLFRRLEVMGKAGTGVKPGDFKQFLNHHSPLVRGTSIYYYSKLFPRKAARELPRIAAGETDPLVLGLWQKAVSEGDK